MQGQHPRYVRANAGCKHFDVYAGPDNTRDTFDAKVGYSQENIDFLNLNPILIRRLNNVYRNAEKYL